MDIQAIQAEIRADAEIIRRQMAAEERLRISPADAAAEILYPIAPLHVAALEFLPRPTPRVKDGSYHYRDFAAFEDEAFVDNAYRALLRHAPDPEGLSGYTRMLRAGKHKAEILARLRFSHEGRAQRVRLRGLLLPAAFAGLGYVPVLGAIVDWIGELVFLSSTMHRLRLQSETLRLHTNRNLERLAAKINEQSRMLNALNGDRSPGSSSGDAPDPG